MNLTRYSLLSLLSTLILLHLSLVLRSDNTDLIGSSLLYWFAAILIFRQNYSKLNFQSNPIAIILGTLLLLPVLTKSAFITGNDIGLRFLPLFSIASLSLIASGSLKPYWRELLLLSIFTIPPGFILLFFDPSAITAKIAGFSLWLLGFDVTVQGVLVSLPKGSIEVYSACAGVATMLQLFGVALMYLFLQPTPDHELNKPSEWNSRLHERNLPSQVKKMAVSPRQADFVCIAANSIRQAHLWIHLIHNPKQYQKLFIPIFALLLAFILNAFRVALMAVLVALGDEKAFEYWHIGNGSLVFSVIAVALFCCSCQIYESRSH